MNDTLRRSQLITTWGPGSLLDLPDEAVIVGGLDGWPKLDKLDEIDEPRLTAKIQYMTNVPAPRLYAPPVDKGDEPFKRPPSISVWRFPEWFVVQEDTSKRASEARPSERARRLVPKAALDKGRFEKRRVVPIRFVQACVRGHVNDIDWRSYVHNGPTACRQQLWLDESGTSGDLTDLMVKCDCGEQRSLYDASNLEQKALGACRGHRPWLGVHADEACDQPNRLLIRSASNAYFPQIVTTLSLPERGSELEQVVRDLWSTYLRPVTNAMELGFVRKFPAIAERLDGYDDADILDAISAVREGGGEGRPVKLAELDVILDQPEGYGDDIPIDPNFHARRLPERVWRKTERTRDIATVVQLHRLREVSALVGFTRFEPETPDIHGEYETDVSRADLATEPRWYPAVENRGEGIFLELAPAAVRSWLARSAVQDRLKKLMTGHEHWQERRRRARAFPGGPYVLLHTLSHLLIQSLSLHSGYPASSIKERIYSDTESDHYGILLYTGSPDADGTLGGLVQQARRIETHLANALRAGALCSNDPICAQHEPDRTVEERWLLGAACHGCSLIAETSCEMRNDHLDRGLVVPILGEDPATAFFDLTA